MNLTVGLAKIGTKGLEMDSKHTVCQFFLVLKKISSESHPHSVNYIMCAQEMMASRDSS